MPSPSISIDPASALIDIPRTIRLQEFTGGEHVTVVSSLQHDDGTAWRGEATFAANQHGEVNLHD